MKQKITSAQSIIEAFLANGKMGIREIANAIGISDLASKDLRAIQRSLATLIEEGIIEAEGTARARVYLLKSSLEKKTESHSLENNKFKNIILSKNATELLNYLSNPISKRHPVKYNSDFLKAYQPNKSFYLSSSTRQKLISLGKTEKISRPAGTYARNILNRLLVDLSWNSSRLEGNTYSLLETKRLIEQGENAIGKNAWEAQMIINHKDAIEYIIESVNEEKISSHEILSIHALLSENLLGDSSASGRLRTIGVGISGSSYSPLDNSHLIKEYFEIFIKKINQINDPFEQSFFAIVHLSYLQAFEDVNKRTARLAANIPLIKNNLKPFSFTEVNRDDYATSLLGIYEKNDVSLLQDLYVWAYAKSAERYSAIQNELGEPNLFKIKYRDLIKNIIKKIITENIKGEGILSTIRNSLLELNLSENDSQQLLQIIETEIMNLHGGNIARFKILPREFARWANKGINSQQ